MATYAIMLQRIWREYEAAGNPVPATAREVASWAFSRGLWQPPEEYDPVADLAEDLAKAWREEYRVDNRGRRYRAKHAVRVTSGGVQYAFWADIDTAPAAHVIKALAQKRRQIVDDCYRLKVDVDHYNEIRGESPLFQLVLDFTPDVQEIEELEESRDGQAA